MRSHQAEPNTPPDANIEVEVPVTGEKAEPAAVAKPKELTKLKCKEKGQ